MLSNINVSIFLKVLYKEKEPRGEPPVEGC